MRYECEECGLVLVADETPKCCGRFMDAVDWLGKVAPSDDEQKAENLRKACDA